MIPKDFKNPFVAKIIYLHLTDPLEKFANIESFSLVQSSNVEFSNKLILVDKVSTIALASLAGCIRIPPLVLSATL